MQKGIKIDGQMRALAMALGGAIVMSVVAMFIPVSVFESITEATGFPNWFQRRVRLWVIPRGL